MKFVIEHFIQLLLVVLSVATLTFLLVRLSPGDPATIMLKSNDIPISEEALNTLRTELGLTHSLGNQYLDWLKNVVTLQWGNSYISKKPVIHELMERLPATLELAFAGLAVMLVMTFVLGLSTAITNKGIIDRVGKLVALLGAAIPTFWLGFLCIYVFSVQLGWLPSMGRGTWQHLILPAVTLGLGLGTVYARVLRAQIIDMRNQHFVKASQARGLSNTRILLFQVLKHAMLPIVTMIGTSFAFMLSGSIIVESIFSWPGIGQYVIQSIHLRDYPVIQGYSIFAALLFIAIHTLVDLIYLIIDPRLRV
ncbi:nickel ABC transporter permease [Lysinibacillus pakistanensis]|uniref:nickel ABC transporter permease n=1 Tax=Lysinibacillus pakistanensis TaxID=759811 RepID=UPI003D274FC3